MAGPQKPTYDVCGIPIAAVKLDSAVRRIVAAATNGERLESHLCNAYTLSLVDSDAELRHALLRSDLNLPDGTPVSWLGRKYGTNGPVRGPDLVVTVVDRGRAAGLRHSYLGGAPGVAETMAANLEARYPGTLTAGTESPPFAPVQDAVLLEAVARIRGTAAQVVWVGLGTPRQDYIVPRLAAHLELPIVPVGAAFDFWAGNAKQAPWWLHGTGLEWVHRLVCEPRRLWRRYLLGNPRFIALAVRHWMGSK